MGQQEMDGAMGPHGRFARRGLGDGLGYLSVRGIGATQQGVQVGDRALDHSSLVVL